jgi:putative tryptophan/tyrosine transport system substrate-binding protein
VSKNILTLSLGAVTFWCASLAIAQHSTAKMPRIGVLVLGSHTTGPDPFLQGLKDLGYVEGRNISIEYRFAEGKEDRLTDLAAELVQLKVDVIVTGGTAAARAVLRLTKTIPIVVPDSADPVGVGLVKSLAQPGGNITGLTIMSPQLGAKRFELLKEVFPRVSRVAVVIRSANPHREAAVKEMEFAAQSLGVGVHIVAVQEVNEIEIENIFALITRKRVQAFILIPTPTFTYYRKVIVELALKSRLPAIYPHRGYVEAGGLMSYAANNADLARRAAYYVDKILKGAKPAELPIEQPTKFELVINMKAAKALGLTIPPSLLQRADQVIE